MKQENLNTTLFCQKQDTAAQENFSAEHSYVNVSFENETDITETDLEKTEPDLVKTDHKLPHRENELQTNDENHTDAAVFPIHGTVTKCPVVPNEPSEEQTDLKRRNSKLLTLDIELSRQSNVPNWNVSPITPSPFDSTHSELAYKSETTNLAKDSSSAATEDGITMQTKSMDPVALTRDIQTVSANLDVNKIELKIPPSENDNTKDKKRKLQEICQDTLYRSKLVRTLFIFWNFTTFGWVFGMSGPTLPDLQLLTGSSLQMASWLFTGFNIGYLVSCASSGFVHRRVNPDILLFLYTAVNAMSMCLLPWLPNIYAMAAVRGILGYCCGGQDIELHAMIFATWHSEGGVYLQLTHFLFAVGGILSPLASKPFMIKTIQETVENKTFENSSSLADTTSRFAYGCELQSDAEWNQTFSGNANCDIAVSRETNIQVAYLISATIVISAAIPFLVFYIINRKQTKDSDTEHEENGGSVKLSNKIQLLVVVLLCVISAIGTALVDTFPSYLATFGMLQLDWTQDNGSSMTSLFFSMYAVGNLLGVFILKRITSRSFIYLAYFTSIGSLFLLFTGVQWGIGILQTITVAAIGLTVSAILPTIFTWTQAEVTPVSGKIASAFLFAGSAGGMANPVLLGYLMESVTPIWFVYLTFSETFCCLILYTIAVLIVKKYKNSYRNEKAYQREIRKSNSVVKNISDSFDNHRNKQQFDLEYHTKSTIVHF